MVEPDNISQEHIKNWEGKRADFHAAMGECIGTWASVDEKLFEIFRACVGPPIQCAIIFYRTPGIDARLNLTDEIVKSILPRPKRKNGGHPHVSVKEWDTLRKNISDKLGFRRRVAHHPVHVQIWGSEDSDGKIVDINFDLTALTIDTGRYEKAREPEREYKPLDVNDLRKHAAEVSALADSLGDFLERTLANHIR